MSSTPDLSSKHFLGSSFQKAMAEVQRYDQLPEETTPVEIMHWALDVGQWTFVDFPSGLGGKVWSGPLGTLPTPGSPLCVYFDQKIALQAMKEQYEGWWMQRDVVRRAIQLFLQEPAPRTKKITAKCDVCGTQATFDLAKAPAGGLLCPECGTATCFPLEDPPGQGDED